MKPVSHFKFLCNCLPDGIIHTSFKIGISHQSWLPASLFSVLHDDLQFQATNGSIWAFGQLPRYSCGCRSLHHFPFLEANKMWYRVVLARNSRERSSYPASNVTQTHTDSFPKSVELRSSPKIVWCKLDENGKFHVEHDVLIHVFFHPESRNIQVTKIVGFCCAGLRSAKGLKCVVASSPATRQKHPKTTANMAEVDRVSWCFTCVVGEVSEKSLLKL